MEKQVCKNCKKEIYQEKDGTWYHSEDDYEICGANLPITGATMFWRAQPLDGSSAEKIRTSPEPKE